MNKEIVLVVIDHEENTTVIKRFGAVDRCIDFLKETNINEAELTGVLSDKNIATSGINLSRLIEEVKNMELPENVS